MVNGNLAGLLLPNLTSNTLIGVILIVIGVLILFFLGKRELVAKTFPLIGKENVFGKALNFVAVGLILLGVYLTFVVSFFEDIFASLNLTVTFFGIIIIGLAFWLLFIGNNKKRRKRKRK